MDSKSNGWWMVAAAAFAGGGAWMLGTGLHPWWVLTWFAPLPALLIAPRVNRMQAWIAAFAGYALGALNMWNYMHKVVPILVVGIASVVGPALLFTACVGMFRARVVKGQLASAVLITPSLWVGVMYLYEYWSPHSTFGDLAYTQMDFLPVLQVVSVTGIYSISFLLLLLPAAIAAMCAPGQNRGQKTRVALIVALSFAAVMGFGTWRLMTAPATPRVTVGLIDSDARIYAKGDAAVALIRGYASQLPVLAAQGAQVVVIPEKIGGFGVEEITATDAILGKAAEANHLDIVVGVERLPNFNEARYYSSDGVLAATYEKHHMLPPFESYMAVGTRRTLLTKPGGTYGLEICKDMDFPRLSREYGEDGARLMLVPAWDFVTDGWLHGRMAILRGVESGFSIARAAKEGYLTVSDDRGRVVSETVTTKDGLAYVVASVPMGTGPTFYARTGDWFAWGNLMLLGVLFLIAMKRRTSTSA